MKVEDVEMILRVFTSDVNDRSGQPSIEFRATIEEALGAAVFGRLQDVVFEDDLDSGLALSFDFEGERYWLEQMGGGFLSLSRLSDEGDICILHPQSNEFKEEFLNSLIASRNEVNTIES
jgi:hypothetical protein